MPENTVVDCWKYQPLEGPRSIRLIEFSPSLLNPLEIQLRLKDVCLDEAPPYHALSYAWGPLTDKTITFHGAEGEKSLPVNDNCKEAIEAFEQAVARSNSVLSFTTDDDPTMPESQQEKSADIIHLWVDNICIDQADDAEADFHRQLLLMCEIYQNAKTTIVWLGQEEADAGYCLDAIKTAFPADQSTRILPIDESTLTSRSSETQKQSQNVRIATVLPKPKSSHC
jgi:hypothetical protein